MQDILSYLVVTFSVDKMITAIAKTQIRLGISHVTSVFAVDMKKGRMLSYSLNAQQRLI